MPITVVKFVLFSSTFLQKPFVIEDGERIAQMVIARHEQALWQEVKCWMRRSAVPVGIHG